MASPVTVIGLAVPVALRLPGLALTVYPVIGLPPLEAGALKLTTALALPPLAVPMTGAPGALMAGVTLLLAAEALPVPTALVAVTVKV